MRVIEPTSMVKRPDRSKKKAKKRPVRTVSILVGLIIISFGLLAKANSYYAIATKKSHGTLAASTVEELQKVAGASDSKFKFFTGDQFQSLYELITYPNTQPISDPPAITGNPEADARIRTIADSRGYKLRSVPVLPIIKTREPRLRDDDLQQPKAYSAWLVLKDMAKKDGVPLVIISGYRSIEMQRELFTSRLYANGADAAKIASGQADNAIVQTLHLTAPPGYSRHHTGYTMDLACDDGTGRTFLQTECNTWLSANNYDKAKRSGWVPSYPVGGDNQGPEPEPWEYVWVGLDQVIE